MQEAETNSDDFVLLSSYSHIQQFVEVIHEDKSIQLVSLIDHLLAEPLRFPNIKMLIFASDRGLDKLSLKLKETESIKDNINICLVHSEQSAEEQAAVVKGFKNGILFVGAVSLDSFAGEIPQVNFVINYSFPANDSNLVKWYCDRLACITSNNAFVINIITAANSVHVAKLIEILQEMNQRTNPMLLKMKEIFMQGQNHKAVAKLLKHSKSIIKWGSLADFFNLTTTSSIQPRKAPATTSVIPKITGSTCKITHFIEVLEHEQKFDALKTILNAVQANPKRDKLKMLLVATDSRITMLEALLPKHFLTLRIVSFPPLSVFHVRSTLLNNFRHGLFLVKRSEFGLLGLHAKEIKGVDIFLSYEFHGLAAYTKYLSELSSTDACFAISFVTPETQNNKKLLINFLRDKHQVVNPFLIYMSQTFEKMEHTLALKQISEELKVKRFLITQGNLAAFLYQLNAATTTKYSHIRQFVEVLNDEEKSETLMSLIKKLFCDDFSFSKSKMLVFTADTNIPMLQDYLENQFLSLAAISPQILVLREDCSKLDRRNIVNAFHSGILLLGEFSFADTQNKTGIEFVNFVVNYDCNMCDSEEDTQPEQAYLNRISNIDVAVTGSAITFITKSNLPLADVLGKVLLDSKQELNPSLLEMISDQDIAQTDSRPKAIKVEKDIEKGNIFAFFEFLASNAFTTPSVSTTQIPLEQSPTISATSAHRCLQFVEVLPMEQKPDALLNVLNQILQVYAYERVKILVFLRGLSVERIKKIDDFLSIGIATHGLNFLTLARLYAYCKDDPGVIQHNFNMFAELPSAVLFTDVDSRFLGLSKADFIIFYDAPNNSQVYLDSITRYQSVNSCDTYFLTFLIPTDTHPAKGLIEILRAHKQKINPALVQLASDVILTQRTNIEKGNMSALFTLLRSQANELPTPSPPICDTDTQMLPPDCSQFVEVLSQQQKPFTFLNMVQRILALTCYGQVKILVFMRGLTLEKIQQFDYLLRDVVKEGQISNFSRLFAPCKGETSTIQHNLKLFADFANAILFTDVDSRYLGINSADFIIFFDSPNSSTIYLDSLTRFKSKNSSHTHFVTFFVPSDSNITKDLVEIFEKLNQEVNPHHSAPANGHASTSAVQQAVATKKSNVAALFEALSHQTLMSQQTIVAAPSRPECLQYIEVLTIDEKADTLLDLFQYILSLNCYKNIKIIVFVRGFTEERVKQFDSLLGSEMKKVLKKYPDFHRFYACVCAASVIKSNLKSFLDQPNAVLITDVDSRYLGVHLADFVIFYDSPNGSDVYSDALTRFYSGNSVLHTNFITFLLASDCNLTKALVGILNEYNLPVNPLIYKLVDRIKHPITDSAIRDLRPTIKIGNLYALYNFDQGTNLTPYSDFAQLKRKLPTCILEWLSSSGYKPLGVIQSHVWPVMFAKMDLLAIAPNSEERILTFVLSAITWIIQERREIVEDNDEIRPIVVIFTPTLESVKQIQQLIKLLDHLLSKNGYEENLNSLISVEQPVQLFQAMSVERKHSFSKCKYVVFDEFDKMMKLGYMDEVANILLAIRDEKMFDGDVCLNVFSGEFSVFEKLVSLEFLENYHYFNMAEVTGQQLSESGSLNNFSHIQQYVEVMDVGADRLQSLNDLLKRILEIDRNSKYATIVFLAGEDATLFAVYNKLISDMPTVSKQVFYNKLFISDSDRSLFWQHFESHKNPILLTNDMWISKKVQNVKYVINFDFPMGVLSAFQYFKRMSNINCKTGYVISYFGLQDFEQSDIFVELLKHTKQTINPLLCELKLFTQQEEVTHRMFTRELKRLNSNAIGDLSDFYTKLSRRVKKSVLSIQYDDLYSSKRPLSSDSDAESSSSTNKKVKTVLSPTQTSRDSISGYLEKLTQMMTSK